MRTLDKHSHWWKKEEKEWATQGRDGNWYIYKRDKAPAMKIKTKRTSQHSLGFGAKGYLIIALGAALGISLALNIVALIS